MRTPVADFIDSYIAGDGVRAHMPGHKGAGPLGIEVRDITEIAGADVLSESVGILGESQKNACTLFGTGATLYSTEGSSLAVKAMLYSVMMHWKQGVTETEYSRPFILAARNVHRAMLDGCALLDLDLEFIRSGQAHGLCSAVVTAQEVEKSLKACGKLPAAVYLTSPDYLGVQSDIAAIAEVCHKYGTLLAVDNAHGAYLAFLEASKHPIHLGADLCCDSAHKTLPVLTGGAYLHLNENIVSEILDSARKGLTMFGSTSPSYLILQSLDLCNEYLEREFRRELAECVKKIRQFKKAAGDRGLHIMEGEPLKIVIDTGASGYDGEEIAGELREFVYCTGGRKRSGIECEFADHHTVVFMMSPQNGPEDWNMMYRWLDRTRLRHPEKAFAPAERPGMEPVIRRMTIREAVFAESEVIPVREAEGRILAQETVSCPPAIPIAVSGEEIDGNMIRVFEEYGIRDVSVVK